jgi:GDPmannose 4,6-dehydratase|tara:strand:- start:1953 stop:3014 length:1062 start_codon:yes stop_codon:yes gene_type:complete
MEIKKGWIEVSPEESNLGIIDVGEKHYRRKKAFITGIAGQDGSYLAEYLVELGYDVHGTVRRNSTAENQDTRIAHLEGIIHTYYADLLDQGSLERLLDDVQPDEIYNIAAQSHVRISFDIPQFTVQTNALGVLNILEAYRRACPTAKFYQASSSEMFGLTVEDDNFQRETTIMNPVSPYGCSKVFGYNIVRNYRRAYKLHATNGILFNHESPRRGSNFVTNKVAKAAARIKLGLQDKLELGNMDSYRDWGHSYDYVRAMHLMMQQDEPGDWVVSTMETHSVREMCELVFNRLGLDYKDYVVQNPKFLRPEELPYLRGDSTKIRTELGWKPKYTFKEMMEEMADYWLEYFGKNK